MAEIVAMFFQVIGPDLLPPSNMQELIPYLITIFIGVVLVVEVIRVIGGAVKAIMAMRRF